MGGVGRLSRAPRVVGRAVEGGLAEEDLEAWEFDVLATLRRSGEPCSLTPKERAGTVMAGSAAMTHRVDRLLPRGPVIRETAPADRRRTLATLAPEGLELIDRAVAHQRGLLAGLGEKEREQLADPPRKLLLPLDDTVWGRARPPPPQAPLRAVAGGAGRGATAPLGGQRHHRGERGAGDQPRGDAGVNHLLGSGHRLVHTAALGQFRGDRCRERAARAAHPLLADLR